MASSEPDMSLPDSTSEAPSDLVEAVSGHTASGGDAHGGAAGNGAPAAAGNGAPADDGHGGYYQGGEMTDHERCIQVRTSRRPLSVSGQLGWDCQVGQDG